MTIEKIRILLDADILCGEEFLNRCTDFAFSSDMMSDVLAYAEDQSLLVTGLCNAQVVRTAEMLDIVCLIFVCGKCPASHILDLAKEKGIVVLSTSHQMFTTCGILYNNGLRGGA